MKTTFNKEKYIEFLKKQIQSELSAIRKNLDNIVKIAWKDKDEFGEFLDTLDNGPDIEMQIQRLEQSLNK